MTTEGKIFGIGVLLALLLILAILYYGVYDRELSRTLGLVFIAHTFGGRAAGIGLCIIDQLHLFWTVFYNFYLEVLIVCFTYSIFVLSANNYIKSRAVRFYVLKLERKARSRKDTIARYGWIGLFLFVMTPLPVTGPVVGSIIGYLLKFKIWYNFSATFIGTAAAIIVWTLFFDFLNQYLNVIRYILGGIIALVILSYLKTIKEWITNNV